MEWLSCIREAIDYMEDHLMEIKSPEEVADHVHVSCMYLQRGFQMLTGYTLGEYMRNRRLYLAAVELGSTSATVTEVAYAYGYETPASFHKAFQRFHGVTPMDVKKSRGSIRSFLRMNISITVQGGNSMQFRVERKEAFQVVGFERMFEGDTAYEKIPEFWDEMMAAHCTHIMRGEAPQGDMERYIVAHHVGEYGVCLDDIGVDGKFNYSIAGPYDGSEVPAGMTVCEIEAGDWAVFDCTLQTLQATNTKIWTEWLPGNNAYELAGKYNVEWYSTDDAPGPGRRCQIWIPVRKR